MKRLTLSALSAIASSPAMAMYDTAFYTYGNFQIVVDAFKRVALYYSQQNLWILAIFVLGLLVSAAVNSVNNSKGAIEGGQQNNAFLGSLMLSIIGLVVFSAGTVPKGTLHIYDQTKNQYQPVEGVPAVVSLTAGLVSSAIEAFRHSESTASAYTYGALSDGSPFVVLQKSLSSVPALSSDLITNINNIYLDCGSSAIASGSLDIDDLRGGTYSLLDTLEALRHNSIETAYHTSTYPNGQAVTCSEAYDYLRSDLNNPAVFSSQLGDVCHSIGLDSANASERATCQQTLTNAFDIMYSGGSGNVEWQTGLQNLLIAEVISNALRNNLGSEAINIQLSRNSLADSTGAMEATARYIPVLQGVVLSILIGFAPTLLAFVVTPLIGKALKLYFGLFAFYGIWLVCDMVMLTSIEDTLYANASMLSSNQMGLLSVWNTQSSLIDSLATLGQSRTIALTAAVLFTATLFGISAHGLAAFAAKAEASFEEQGKETARESLLRENAGQRMEGLVNGNAYMSGITGGGMTGAIRTGAMDTSAGIREGNLTADTLGGVDRGASALAEHRSAQVAGGALATQSEGFDGAVAGQRIAQEGTYASASAISGVATEMGMSTRDYQEATGTASEAQQAGRAMELSEGDGLLDNSVNAGRDQGARSRAVAGEIDEYGTDGIYRAAVQEHQREVEEARATSDLIGDTKEHFYQTGLRETAEAAGRNDGASAFTPDEISASKAGDYIEDTQSSLTRTETGEDQGLSRQDLARERTVVDTSDEIAERDLRNSIKETLGVSDRELSAMLLDQKSMMINSDQANSLHEAGLINRQQLMTIESEGQGVLHMSAQAGDDGRLSVYSTEANYRESTASDRSAVIDRSVQMNTAANTMDENSSRRTFGNASYLSEFITRQETNGVSGRELFTEVGVGSSRGLDGLISLAEGDSTVGTTGVGGSIDGKTPSLFGVSASASVYGSKDDINTKERMENVLSQHFSNVYGSVDSYYKDKVANDEMTPEEASWATAEAYSGYYANFRDTVANGEVDEFNRFIHNGNMDNVWNQYAQDNGYDIPLLGREDTFDKDHYKWLVNDRESVMNGNEQRLDRQELEMMGIDSYKSSITEPALAFDSWMQAEGSTTEGSVEYRPASNSDDWRQQTATIDWGGMGSGSTSKTPGPEEPQGQWGGGANHLPPQSENESNSSQPKVERAGSSSGLPPIAGL